jgi:plastocyanin
MVKITSFVGVLALVSTMVHGLPRPFPTDDSAIGAEAAVSAPNGIPVTDTIELASQLSREAEAKTKTAEEVKVTQYGGNYGSSEEKSSAYGKYEPTKTAEAESKYTTSAKYEAPKYEAPKYEPKETSSKYEPTKAAEHTYEAPKETKYESSSYGSGSSNWNSGEYEDCVNQCIAKYSSPLGEYKATPTAKNEEKGTGATHTVIVAPTQGLLRFVPFAVNASVGDKVKFMWGADNHTVTRGSALLPCNATADKGFNSELQIKGFEFVQEVTDTEPTYFYCARAPHCQKGMFGMINPKTATGSSSSFGASIQSLAANSSNVMGYMSYTQKLVKDEKAASWGTNLDMDQIPESMREEFAANVFFTRTLLNANPEILKEDGAIDLSTSDSTPLALPQDIDAALNSAGSGAAASSSSTVAAPTPSATEAPAANAGNLNSGAASLSSSKMLVVALAGVVTYFLL